MWIPLKFFPLDIPFGCFQSVTENLQEKRTAWPTFNPRLVLCLSAFKQAGPEP